MHETRTAWTTAANPEQASVTNNILCEIVERFVWGWPRSAALSKKRHVAAKRKRLVAAGKRLAGDDVNHFISHFKN